MAAVIAYAVSVTLLASLLKRRNLRGERMVGATVLRYPRAWHYVAWGFLIVPLAGLGWLAWKFPPKPNEVIYFVALIAGFGLIGAYLVLEVSGVAHELRPNGFLRVTPWGRAAFFSGRR